MIYVTGDVHGVIKRLRLPHLTEEDTLIICGDFGFLWDESNADLFALEILRKKKFKILFVDGNHENFDILESYPIENWGGGKIQKINENVYHLLRGEVYTIEGKKFFCFGGAMSTDKEHRIKGVSWWPQEIPNYIEFDNAYENLERNHWKVDYVITHTAPAEVVDMISRRYGLHFDRMADPTARMLTMINAYLEFEDWYFGHFHLEDDYGKFHCLYNTTKKLED